MIQSTSMRWLSNPIRGLQVHILKRALLLYNCDEFAPCLLGSTLGSTMLRYIK